MSKQMYFWKYASWDICFYIKNGNNCQWILMYVVCVYVYVCTYVQEPVLAYGNMYVEARG